MSNPVEVAVTLQRELPPFQSGLIRGLRLDSSDQREIKAMDWEVWTPWMVAALSGGERMPGLDMEEHPSVPSLSERGRALLGTEVTFDGAPCLYLERGELSQRAQALGAKKDLGSQGRFDTLTTACAKFLITSCALMGPTSRKWQDQVPSVPQTRIDVERGSENLRIRFPRKKDFQYPLGTAVGSVVTFGPGMSGGVFVGDMIGRAKTIHLVSGGISASFIRKWNRGQLNEMAGNIELARRTGAVASWAKGLLPDQIQLPETFYYDDGIAGSIGTIASRTVERGKPVDVVVMSSVHSAGRQEVEAGVDGAHRLLGDGGLLVVKAPRTSIGNEGGMDVAAGTAIPLFGSPVAAGEVGLLDQYIDPSLPVKRPADFAIFQKQ